MTDGDNLLRAILSNPDDDTVRLVYADWLQENGQADRAEFIRVQCERAMMEESGEPCEIDPNEGHTCCEDPCPVCASVEKYAGLERRERELLDAGEWQWLHACCSELHRGSSDHVLTDHPVTHWLYPHVWRRGFLKELTLNADAWLEMADQVYWHPEQTAECDLCEGNGWIEIDVSPKSGPYNGGPKKMYVTEPSKSVRHGCQACGGSMLKNGTGRVTRPFTPTAHPIAVVILTTSLTAALGGFAASYTPDDVLREMEFDWLRVRWPRIDFTLA